MLSREPLSIAGKALIGIMALLGANMANAVVNLDMDVTTANFAQETVTATLTGKDGATYFVVKDGTADHLDVEAMLGFETTNTASLVVRYDFTGMILTGTAPPTLDVGSADGVGTLRQGGQAKDDYVVFLVPASDVANDRVMTTVVRLNLGEAAVAASGVMISMHIKDDLSIPAETTAGMSGAVALTSGLTPMKVKRNPVASVDDQFMVFVDGDGEGDNANLAASVGRVVVTENTDLLDANDGTMISGGDLIVDTGSPTANTATPNTESRVIFKGDFSFAMSVTLKRDPSNPLTDPICTDGGTNLMMDEEDDVRDTTRLKTQSLSYLNDNPNLCITVMSGEMAMPIPATQPYIVEKEIMLVGDLASSSKFVPMPDPAELGAISRDGTTVRLPYLTQYPLYNQRIVVVNRGRAAEYNFDFMSEDRVTTTRGPRADGTLMPNSVTYFSLANNDLVMIEGSPNRAAATFIVGTQTHNIDVLVSQTNEGGSTDTVTYTQTDR